MTKEELEKEAEEFTDRKKSFWRQGRTCIDSVKQAYLAGAEPREKRIAELEKENAELRTVKVPQLERKIASIRGAHSVDCRKLNARTEQVERLKKENAELKSDFIRSCKVKEQGFKEAEQALERKDKQLTKAKEIIEAMLIYQEGFSHMRELKQEAEQFLKEE